MVYWEITRACDLICRHCRADAVTQRHPFELDTSQGKQLLKAFTQFTGKPAPHFVITGGDPLKRPDLFELISYGKQLGLMISLAPSGTNRLTKSVIKRLKKEGITSLSLSIDGSTQTRHDRFRGVSGCFDITLAAARIAVEVDLPVQINTLVSTETIDDLPSLYKLLCSLDIIRWSLFFLIPTGRGRSLRQITPSQSEELDNWLYRLSKSSPFAIKTTEAPHFRRVAMIHMKSEGLTKEQMLHTSIARGFGIRDGNGIMFISHTGQVFPSGFLPISAGNVRKMSPVSIYRESEVFTKIRDVDNFKGKCGRCEFRFICGGSRARAYATVGDYLASDPLCSYKPRRAF